MPQGEKKTGTKGVTPDSREVAGRLYKACGRQGQAGQSRQAGWPRAGCHGFLLLPTPLWSPAKVLIPPKSRVTAVPQQGHIGRLAEPLSPGQDRSAQSNARRAARGSTGKGVPGAGMDRGQAAGLGGLPGVVNSSQANVDNPGAPPRPSIRRLSRKVLLYHRTAGMVNGFCPLTAGTFLSPSVRMPTSLRLLHFLFYFF